MKRICFGARHNYVNKMSKIKGQGPPIGLIFLYKTITKRNVLWIDITVFFIVIAIAQTVFVLMLSELAASTVTVILATVFLFGLLVAFSRFTLRPPREPDVFIDPMNQKYGLQAHPDLGPEE